MYFGRRDLQDCDSVVGADATGPLRIPATAIGRGTVYDEIARCACLLTRYAQGSNRLPGEFEGGGLFRHGSPRSLTLSPQRKRSVAPDSVPTRAGFSPALNCWADECRPLCAPDFGDHRRCCARQGALRLVLQRRKSPTTNDRQPSYSFGSTIPFCDWYLPLRSA
jgi:hypothetical protein